MLRVEVNIYRLPIVDNRVDDTPISAVFGVELQVLDHIAQQDARPQDLHLVLDTRGVAQKAQILDIGQHLGGILLLVLILDEHTGRHLIDRFLVAQIDKSATHTDDERQKKPLPVEHQHSKQVGQAEP